jgi:hypothetical protein
MVGGRYGAEYNSDGVQEAFMAHEEEGTSVSPVDLYSRHVE